MEQKIKEQKLSPMRYIRNNKRRVSVLVVSLSLCITIIYVVNFLVMTTDAMAQNVFLDTRKKSCGIGFSMAFEGEEYEDKDKDDLEQIWNETYRENSAKLDKEENIVKAIPYHPVYIHVNPPIATLGFAIPLIDPENADILLEHMGAKLAEGHLPENPDEIALDRATMLNKGYSVGDKYEEEYTITAMLECDYYFGYGIIGDQSYYGIYVLTKECVEDATTLFPLMGLEYNKDEDYVEDYGTWKLDYEKYVKKQLVDATKYIYVGIFILLFISLFVVYTTYLRDRHNEWCLYCSIGYSRRSIYLSIMGELLFTFAAAIVAGIILTTAMVFALDAMMMKPRGIMCQYFYPDKIAEILCAFVLFFGLLQLPVRYALYKIRTIDAMEDDLY